MTQPTHLSFTLEETGSSPDSGLPFEPPGADTIPPSEAGRPTPTDQSTSPARRRHLNLADRSVPFVMAAAILALTALAGLMGYEWLCLEADKGLPHAKLRMTGAAPSGMEDRPQAFTRRSPSP